MDFPVKVWSVFRCPNKTGYSKVDTPYVMGFWTVYFVVFRSSCSGLCYGCLTDCLSAVSRSLVDDRQSQIANRKLQVASMHCSMRACAVHCNWQLATGGRVKWFSVIYLRIPSFNLFSRHRSVREGPLASRRSPVQGEPGLSPAKCGGATPPTPCFSVRWRKVL